MRKFTKGLAVAATVLAVGGVSLAAMAQMGGPGYGPRGSGGYGDGPGMMGGYGYGPGMMGGYGMGPGMMFGAFDQPVYPGWGGGVLGYQQVRSVLHDSDQSGVADAKSNTVTYTGKDVTINMIAVQPGHDDQTFEVHGLTNPTLVVPQGATVHLRLVNMDYGPTMAHGLILTPVPPPYPYMAMMATGPGLANVMPLLPWRSAKDVQQANFAVLESTFVAREPGTYWYVCPTPRHAEQGMFGKFVVR